MLTYECSEVMGFRPECFASLHACHAYIFPRPFWLSPTGPHASFQWELETILRCRVVMYSMDELQSYCRLRCGSHHSHWMDFMSARSRGKDRLWSCLMCHTYKRCDGCQTAPPLCQLACLWLCLCILSVSTREQPESTAGTHSQQWAGESFIEWSSKPRVI